MSYLTPSQIVRELDRYIVKQDNAKKAVAIALRNRWRRQQAPKDIREEIFPNNIIMIGPTGVGKTEIARRLAKLVRAPFIKVEASNYTEVGYVGRDVESMVRDLVEIAVGMVKAAHKVTVNKRVDKLVEERLIELIVPASQAPQAEDLEAQERRERTRDKIRNKLKNGELEERKVTLKKPPSSAPLVEIFSRSGIEEFGFNFPGNMNPFAPQKSKERELTIREAREQLAAEETDKLLDMEKIIDEAKRLTESNGIIFVDEIDKIAGGGSQSGPDVSREGVQRDLLPIIEGSTVNTRYGPVKTDHILFIGAGAFNVAKPSDLIPEFQGRFPIRVELSALDQEDFVRILKEPANSLLKQYGALLDADNCAVEFSDDAISEIARVAGETNARSENIGARRLHTVMSTLLEEILFELPESKRDKIIFTGKDVCEKLDRILADEDLARYIL
ncbi:MAG: ATP-dependent protease ATPase subunit HslU [Candidatus Latescibacterota bacterium]